MNIAEMIGANGMTVYTLKARGTFVPPVGPNVFDQMIGDRQHRFFTIDKPFTIAATSLENAIENLIDFLDMCYKETVTDWVVYEA